MSTHLLLYRQSGTIFDLPVQPGPTFGDTSAMGTWDNDWTHIVPFGPPTEPYFLLYKKSSGKVFTMPILSAGEYGTASPSSTWETDWEHIVPFSVSGHDYLLLYRASGEVFYLPILPGPKFGASVHLGTWVNDLAHICYFAIEGQPFFLLVRKNGEAFTARISFGQTVFEPGFPAHSGKPSVESPIHTGQWETDWALIRVFTIHGSPYVLFYRTSGEVFISEITLPAITFLPPESQRPSIGQTIPAGTWETDWAEIAPFEIGDLMFGIDRFDIINQKSDSDHADNDSLSLVWAITKATTKEQTIYQKTLMIPGALRSGQSASGPFLTDPFKLAPGDVLTVTAVVSNLGSSKTEEQFTQAVQITKKVVDDLGPLIGVVVASLLGGIGVIGGFEKGKTLTEAFDWAIGGLSDLADLLGIHAGPPNCNGVVLSASWIYGSGDFPAAIGVSSSQQIAGPGKDRCGSAPLTNVVWSILTT